MMKKYMVLYYSPMSPTEQMQNASLEEMQKGMEPWFAWQKEWGEGIVDMGMPLDNSHKMDKSGEMSGDSHIAGYSIIQADSMEKALEMVKNHPHLQMTAGAEVEVHEMLGMPGM
jgi:hypothetical protein